MSDVSEVRAMYESSAAELRAEIERLTYFGELARQAALRAEERAGVAEQALTAARTALNYISSPTMGLPSGADAAEFCMVGATEHAARYALNICIRQAREALSVVAGGASTTTSETKNG